MKYHEDNTLSWLEVPIAKLKELGIEREISTYSHIDEEKGLAYLYRSYDTECDVEVLLAHCPELEISKLESIQSERSFIRDLKSYTRFELTGLETLLLTVKKLDECKFKYSVNVGIAGGCMVYGSYKDIKIEIIVKESSILMRVDRISTPNAISSVFIKKIERPAKGDVEKLIFKGCTDYQT